MLRWLKMYPCRDAGAGTALDLYEGIHGLLGTHGGGKTTRFGRLSRVVRADFSAVKDQDVDLGIRTEVEREILVARVRYLRKKLSGVGL